MRDVAEFAHETLVSADKATEAFLIEHPDLAKHKDTYWAGYVRSRLTDRARIAEAFVADAL